MKTTILSVLLLVTSLSAYCQIGIYTQKPQADFDVNGDLSIRGSLKVGTDQNSGNAGDILTSRGAGVPPQWETITTTVVGTGNFLLTNVYKLESQQSVSFRSGTDLDNLNIYLDMPYTSTIWGEIPSTELEFVVEQAGTTVLVSFQTSVISDYQNVSISSSAFAGLYTNFIGGLFLSSGTDPYVLKIARVGQVTGNRTPQKVFNIFFSFNNLAPGSYKIKPAFIRLDSDSEMATAMLYVGAFSGQGYTPFMTKSTIKLDIYTPR